MKKKNVVVIGGGTGTHTVLCGLKHCRKQLDISAVVAMTDSGGSTGRLRDEFGYLPVGDVRMALVALASDIDKHEVLIRKLFLHRFDKGNGLSGHNFGNLLLVALTDLLGSEEAAIRAAGRVLQVQGSVVPVTTEKINLVAEYENGERVTGEHEIDEPPAKRSVHRITNLSITPQATISSSAEAAILNADLIVLGPGDLYTSILANCVVNGVAEAIRNSGAIVMYICNLMTKAGQTAGFGCQEHVAEIAKYLGRWPSAVLFNTAPLPQELLGRYAAEGEYPVENDCQSHNYKLIATDLLASESFQNARGDTLKRSLIRHDSEKLAHELVNLLRLPHPTPE